MNIRLSRRMAAMALLAAPLLADTASAQFGTGYPGAMNLPQQDFRWTWGRARRAGQGIEDFTLTGNQDGFRCGLTGVLSPASRRSRSDLRQLERSISSSLLFVQAAANAMYDLEARGELEWAVLDCVHPQASAEDEEKRARREARALEKAARERERRRARRARQESDEEDAP